MNDGKELLADVNYERIRVECYSGYKVNERPIVLPIRDAVGKYQKYWIAGMKEVLMPVGPQ